MSKIWCACGVEFTLLLRRAGLMFLHNNFDKESQLALLLRAVESAKNGVVMTDPRLADNPIIYTNPAFTEITGYSGQEILGRNCRFLQGTETKQAALEDVRTAIRQEKSVTAVLRNYRKDGSLFYNELTISPVRDESGELVAFVGIQNDITARIEAEKRISDFYSIISHELRTPIAKIKSSLSVIADGEAGPVTDAINKFLQISIKSADSLWRLIENILDFKKLESGKFRLLCQDLSLNQLLESTVAEFESVASAAGVKLSCRVPESRVLVSADGQRLVQVLENLLSNAVKFSPENSLVIVSLSVLETGFARVEVTDSGPGIAEDDFSKLFDKFQQLEAPDQRTRGGTGLGLAVCKSIIEAHQGSVGVASKCGQGSTFWFELKQLQA